MTIKDLLEAYQAGADSEFRINDVELDHVRFPFPLLPLEACHRVFQASWTYAENSLCLCCVLALQITFVGVISNYAAGDTNVSMTVEDGTGEISVRMWLETAADDTGKAAQLE